MYVLLQFIVVQKVVWKLLPLLPTEQVLWSPWNKQTTMLLLPLQRITLHVNGGYS